MLKDLLQLQEDIDSYNLLREFDNELGRIDDSVCFKIGTRIFWYYEDSVSYFEEMGIEPRECINDIFSGIVVPSIGYEYRGGEIDFDNVVVVIDQMPSEKEYPNIAWVSIKRLLEDDDLVEIFTKSQI